MAVIGHLKFIAFLSFSHTISLFGYIYVYILYIYIYIYALLWWSDAWRLSVGLGISRGPGFEPHQACTIFNHTKCQLFQGNSCVKLWGYMWKYICIYLWRLNGQNMCKRGNARRPHGHYMRTFSLILPCMSRTVQGPARVSQNQLKSVHV